MLELLGVELVELVVSGEVVVELGFDASELGAVDDGGGVSMSELLRVALRLQPLNPSASAASAVMEARVKRVCFISDPWMLFRFVFNSTPPPSGVPCSSESDPERAMAQAVEVFLSEPAGRNRRCGYRRVKGH
ncbi:MAG: hypothetical protein V4773_29450 [Verrucomicrobiota bacterium]